MKTNDFYRVTGGLEERNDCLVKVGERNYCLIFGFGHEDDMTYHYRKNYDHKPTVEELKADITAIINKHTDERILSGFKWNGKAVWLSAENQTNFKAAYDLAVQNDGALLPIKFKLGEDEQGEPVYHTFNSMNAFADFYGRAVGYIMQCINEGWAEKDMVDYETLLAGVCK